MPGRRVLVVDDDPEVLETLGWAVRHAGFDPEVHTRFDLAKQAIHRAPPDALVTDVRLGAYNGLQLAVLLRAVDLHAPILVVSAFDDPMIRHDAEGLGAVFLTKPVSLEVLGEHLRQLFGAAERPA